MIWLLLCNAQKSKKMYVPLAIVDSTRWLWRHPVMQVRIIPFWVLQLTDLSIIHDWEDPRQEPLYTMSRRARNLHFGTPHYFCVPSLRIMSWIQRPRPTYLRAPPYKSWDLDFLNIAIISSVTPLLLRYVTNKIYIYIHTDFHIYYF